MNRLNTILNQRHVTRQAMPRLRCLGRLILFCAPALALAPVASAASLVVSTPKTYTELEAADANPGDGCLDITGDLVIQNGGSITRNDVGFSTASAGSICIRVGGNLEMMPGGSIFAENRVAGGSGGLISITVSGNLTLHGGASGAVISASKTGGAGDTGVGGDIALQVVGTFVAEPNTKILADSTGFAGDIHLSGASMRLDGAVSTRGSTTVGLGGQIFLIAGGDLTIGDGALVRSRGQDPGADLVHLQGCNVVINGLVESSGPGHWAGAPNHVRPPNRAGKPSTSTGGIEVWAGTGGLTIDSTPPHNGELNANIGLSGGSNGRGWIDLFARGNINIIGDTAGQSAVHANLILGNGIGGVVTVMSSEGGVTVSGRALEANDGAAGGAGGVLVIEADRNINFNSALVYAKGASFGGGGQAGGRILVRSFHGGILGTADSQLNATGGGSPGRMTFQSCNTVTYAGATFPSPTNLPQTCSDTLTLSVFIPACGASTSPTPDDAFD